MDLALHEGQSAVHGRDIESRILVAPRIGKGCGGGHHGLALLDHLAGDEGIGMVLVQVADEQHVALGREALRHVVVDGKLGRGDGSRR